MDVKVMAFELSLGSGISMDDLYNYCIGTSDKAIGKRLLYLHKQDGWWRGLILTTKNIKAFSRLIREKGKIRLSPQALDNGELAHFNYVILNESSKRGYFQYYHGSASVHGFADALKKKYNDIRELRIAEACLKLGKTIDDIPKSVKKQFKGTLQCEIVLRKKTFKELMEEMKHVKNITVQFKEYVPDQPLFRPLAEKAKSIKHRLTFGAQTPVLNNIVDLVTANVIKDLRGVAVSEDDYERPFKFINEPETFDRFDFNEVVLSAEFDSGNISDSMNNSPLIERLFKIAKEDKWAIPKS